jgi:hypothetical protein
VPDVVRHLRIQCVGMTRKQSERLVASVAFCAGALVLISGILGDVARHRDGHLMSTGAAMVGIGDENAELFRWATLTDLLGSYVLMLPLAIWLWRTLRARGGFTVDAATAFALLFTITGAAAAAIWAAAGEPLIEQYAVASGAEAQAVAVTFAAVTNATIGIWHLLAGIGGAVWWIAIGVVVRPRLPKFAVFSILLGGVAALGVAGSMLGIEGDSSSPTWFYFTPIGVWSVWLGVHIWRGTLAAEAGSVRI